jgi:hypothetical protein
MRQDHTHKLLLNTVLLPAMKFQEKSSLKSTTILFTAFESSKRVARRSCQHKHESKFEVPALHVGMFAL